MKFTVEIGNNEKHSVSYSFNKFWGNVAIKVDGKKIIRDFVMYSLSTKKTYSFEIGTNEKHQIVIEKVRPLFLAGVRTNNYNVYVDGELIKQFSD